MKNNITLSIALILLSLVGCGTKESSSSSIVTTSSEGSSSSSLISSVTSSISSTSSSSTSSEKKNLYDANFTEILNEEKEIRTYPSELDFELDNTYKNNLYYYPKSVNPYNDEASKSMIYFSNLYSSLLEYDQYGNLKGGLASSCMYNEHFTRLKFKLRDNLKWTTNGTGTYYDEITIHDFMYGIQHLLDTTKDKNHPVFNIKGAKEYCESEEKDFSIVQIVTSGNNEFEFILNEPNPLFHTYFAGHYFLPLNEEFFTEMGGDVGTKWEEDECDFGGLHNGNVLLLSCGPYIVEKFLKDNIVFIKNSNYWDKDNVKLERIEFNLLTDLQDVNFIKNNITEININSFSNSSLESYYPYSVRPNEVGTSTYIYSWNMNRDTYSESAINSNSVSEKKNTKEAIENINFRKAIFSSIPKHELNYGYNDDKSSADNIRNTVSFPNMEIEGIKYYELVNEEMDKLEGNYAKKKSDVYYASLTAQESSTDLESTFVDSENSYYNEDIAKEYKELAKSDLKDLSFPIKIDLLCLENDMFDFDFYYYYQANDYKDKIIKVLGKDFIDVNIHIFKDKNEFLNALNTGDYDLALSKKINTDYMDPYCSLKEFTNNSEFIKSINLEDNYDEYLSDFNEKYNAACDTKENVLDRYKKFSEAEAALLDTAIVMPYIANEGGFVMGKEIPRTRIGVNFGMYKYSYKYVLVAKNPILFKEYKTINEDFESMK